VLGQSVGYRITFALFAGASLLMIIPLLRVFTPAAQAEVEPAMSAS
jgi:predicted MFS family arabinose efflux permease